MGVPGAETTVNLPVALFIARTTWSLQIRLPITCDKNNEELVIVPGLYPSEIDQLFEALAAITLVGVGDGIREDLDQWKEVVQALWKNAPSLETSLASLVNLEWISRLAGINTTLHSPLRQQLWLTLGVILANGSLSGLGGGSSWVLPFSQLPPDLQLHVWAETQQVCLTAWVLIVAWIAHLFPDAALVRQLTVLTPGALLKWFFDHIVVELLSHCSQLPPRRVDFSLSRRMALVRLGIPPEPRYDVLRLCPDWPAVSGGGARFLHSVRAFLLYNLAVWHSLDPVIWPAGDAATVKLMLFERDLDVNLRHPSTPVEQSKLVAHISVLNILKAFPKNITPERLKKYIAKPGRTGKLALLLEYARLNPQQGLALLLRLEQDYELRSSVFGLGQFMMPMIRLRRLLGALNAMPVRPEGWTDPISESIWVEKGKAAWLIAEKARKRAARLERRRAKKLMMKEIRDNEIYGIGIVINKKVEGMKTVGTKNGLVAIGTETTGTDRFRAKRSKKISIVPVGKKTVQSVPTKVVDGTKSPRHNIGETVSTKNDGTTIIAIKTGGKGDVDTGSRETGTGSTNVTGTQACKKTFGTVTTKTGVVSTAAAGTETFGAVAISSLAAVGTGTVGSQVGGTQAVGSQASCKQAVGTITYGTQAVGTQSRGTQAFDTQATGTQATGTQATGTQATGTQVVGPQVLGLQAIGTQATGTQATGTQAGGPQVGGTHGVGLQAIGTQAVSTHGSRPQASSVQAASTKTSGSGAGETGIAATGALGTAAVGTAAVGTAAVGTAAVGTAAVGTVHVDSGAIGVSAVPMMRRLLSKSTNHESLGPPRKKIKLNLKGSSVAARPTTVSENASLNPSSEAQYLGCDAQVSADPLAFQWTIE